MGITRGAEGKTGRAFVGDMSEEKAVELASKVASEGFLYGVRMGAGRAVLLLRAPIKLRERRVMSRQCSWRPQWCQKAS